jgi:hypothetical protein
MLRKAANPGVAMTNEITALIAGLRATDHSTLLGLEVNGGVPALVVINRLPNLETFVRMTRTQRLRPPL